MKKSLFLLTAAAVAAISACAPEGAYTINGSSECLNDGDTVYVAQRHGREFVNLDTAIVNAGTFAFTGVKEATEPCYILVPAKQIRQLFFLEGGKMTATVDSTCCKVSGSPSNDVYNEVNPVLDSLWDNMNNAWRGYFAPTTTDEMREEMVKIHDARTLEYAKAAGEATLKNIGNPVGLYYLKEQGFRFEVETLHEIFEAIDTNILAADESLQRMKANNANEYATRVGQKFTDFTAKTPDGVETSLSDYAGKGKYVLVDFWASWCGPCCREMPNVVELYAKYKDTGKFEVVGVSLDDNVDDWKAAIEKLGITWPQMSDLQGWQCAPAKLYGVDGIPHTVLIGPDGEIVARDLREKKLASTLEELIK